MSIQSISDQEEARKEFKLDFDSYDKFARKMMVKPIVFQLLFLIPFLAIPISILTVGSDTNDQSIFMYLFMGLALLMMCFSLFQTYKRNLLLAQHLRVYVDDWTITLDLHTELLPRTNNNNHHADSWGIAFASRSKYQVKWGRVGSVDVKNGVIVIKDKDAGFILSGKIVRIPEGIEGRSDLVEIIKRKCSRDVFKCDLTALKG